MCTKKLIIIIFLLTSTLIKSYAQQEFTLSELTDFFNKECTLVSSEILTKFEYAEFNELSFCNGQSFNYGHETNLASEIKLIRLEPHINHKDSSQSTNYLLKPILSNERYVLYYVMINMSNSITFSIQSGFMLFDCTVNNFYYFNFNSMDHFEQIKKEIVIIENGDTVSNNFIVYDHMKLRINDLNQIVKLDCKLNPISEVGFLMGTHIIGVSLIIRMAKLMEKIL